MPRILITGTCGDSINLNAGIRGYLCDAFGDVLGLPSVRAVPRELAEQAIEGFQPNLVLGVGSLVPDTPGLGGLRRAADRVGAKFALWLHDDPYEFDYAFKADCADIVFTNDSWAAEHYNHKRAHHLPLAGSRAHHHRALRGLSDRALDVFFCGVAYPNRVEFLRRADKLLSSRRVAILGSDWPSSIRCARNRRLTVPEMADYAQNSWLTLNIGRDMNIANMRLQLPQSTPGPRTFEVALSGSAQAYFVADLEISRYFTPDREIFLIDGIDDLARLLDRAHDEPQVIYDVAARAQARALTEHTYHHRARRILEVCLTDMDLPGVREP